LWTNGVRTDKLSSKDAQNRIVKKWHFAGCKLVIKKYVMPKVKKSWSCKRAMETISFIFCIKGITGREMLASNNI